MAVPEEFGGGGVADFRFNAVIAEEISVPARRAPASGITLHNDICLPYFLEPTAPTSSRQRWLPGIASGELITAIAMTEPGTGSDLASIATTARRDGDDYVVNGAKTFITNGINADLVITAVKTDPSQRHTGHVAARARARAWPGFERGPQPRQDRPARPGHRRAVLHRRAGAGREPARAEEGQGFTPAGRPTCRRSGCRSRSRRSPPPAPRWTWTLDYVKERKAFGQPIGSFQNSRFVLAELATEIDIAQRYVDDCVRALNAGELTAGTRRRPSGGRTELQGRVVDRCLQLHGGYGYMTEYPIARAYADARITRIYGGTTEIMKEIIGRDLGL